MPAAPWSVKVTSMPERAFALLIALSSPRFALGCPQCARAEPVSDGGALAWLAALPLGLMLVGALALWRWWRREGSRRGEGVG